MLHEVCMDHNPASRRQVESITPSQSPELVAGELVRALLNDEVCKEMPDGGLGRFEEFVQELFRAHDNGGVPAARQVFVAYAQYDDEIAAMVAADFTPQQKIWTATALLNAQFPEQKWIVKDLVPVGLTVLGGRPKVGKSWMSLQLGVAAALGGKFLNRDLDKGKVVYFALEDNARRMQSRLQKQLCLPTSDLEFRFELKPLDKGGIEEIEAVIREVQPKLVVIDTLSRGLGGADQMDQAKMNVTVGKLQRLAIDNEIAIVAVDHHRKGNGTNDVIDDVMGATSKTGVADAAIGLYRPNRGSKDAELKFTGRDIDDQEFAVRFDRDICTWQYVGDTEAVKEGSVQEGILAAIKEHGDAATTAEIAKFLGKQASNVSRELDKLVEANAVVRGKKQGKEVHYHLPGFVSPLAVDIRDNDDNHENDYHNHGLSTRASVGILAAKPVGLPLQ